MCRLGDDKEEEWHPIIAWDDEAAVCEYAEYAYNNRDGWEYMPDSETEIEVKDITTEEIKIYLVTVEFEPSFSASEKKQ